MLICYIIMVLCLNGSYHCMFSVLQSGQVQKVTQFQLSGWTPDGLCTNTRAIIDIIEQVGGVQRRTGNKPIVIHGR